MKKILCAALGALLLNMSAYDVRNPALNPVEFQTPLQHQNLELVKDGRLNFAIVFDKNAEKHLRYPNQKGIRSAVDTLIREIEKSTGQKPEVFDISELEKAKKYPYRLLIGESALTKQLGIDVSKLPREGFLIKTFPEGVAIAGNDSSLDREFNKSPLDRAGAQRGTLWGAYDFLERFFGCRYYYPGKYGSLHPQVRNLDIAPVAYTDYPRFRNRSEQWFIWSLYGWGGEKKIKKEWIELLGPLTDGDLQFTEAWRLARTSPFWAGHNPRPEKFLAAYPEKKETIFYRAPNGNQYYNEKQHIGNYFDVTKLEFADLLVDSLKKYYASNGKENDGWSNVNNTYIPFGQCDSEVPLPDMINNPVVKKENLITQENIRRGFSYSDIYGRFYQYLGNRLKKELPGKKLVLLPYSNYTRAPLNPKWTLPDNVELRVCIFDFPAWTRNREIAAKWQENMNEWYNALGRRPVVSLWLYNVPGNPFARAIAPQLIADVPKVLGKTLGNTELFFDQYGGLEFYYYYANYAGIRGMWNPGFNVDAAIAEHWEPFYGKEAGAYLKQFHKVLFDSYMKYFVPQKERNPLYPVTVINELESLLKKAESSIPPDSIEMKRFRVFAFPWKKAFESQRNRHAYARPLYGAHQLLSTEKITVDGKPDEVWNRVKSMPTLDPRGSNEKPENPSDIKLAWDKKGIYGLVVSPDPPLADENKSIWNNSNVEIFVSPGTKKEDYFHYAVDPFNKRHSGTKQLVPVDKPYNGYWKSPGFQSAVDTTEKGWTLEFFIPYEDLKVKSPRAYDTWMVNIVTNKNSEPKEYSSTAMTLGNNHNLPMYGLLKFLGKGE